MATPIKPTPVITGADSRRFAKVMEMDCIEQIKDIIVSEVNPDKIILFGSRARGDGHKDSDYDILVLKRGINNERKLSGDLKIRFYRERLLFSIDVIVMEHDRFYQLSDVPDYVYRDIKKEGVYIYGHV
jgi:predicted nucleotidyltransferase